MKHTGTRAAFVPRPTPLASCLAVALTMGTAGAFLPASASTTDTDAVDARIIAAAPPNLTDAEREFFVRRVREIAAFVPPVLPANTVTVTNCNDSGAGSLRDAVANVTTGGTVDMTTLACSKITLTSGAIAIGQADLTIQGPGLGLEVSGNDNDRVFWHVGAGTLKVNDLAVTHGRKYLQNGSTGNAGGACIFSAGTAQLKNVWAKYCDTGSNGTTTVVRGGAVYGKTGVGLQSSLVTGSTAHSSVFEARGGGVYTPGSLVVVNSVISGNTATGSLATGGGAQTGSRRTQGTDGGTSVFKYSALSQNESATFGGGAYFTGNTTILQSTISGNASCRGGGSYFVGSGSVTSPWSVASSTVSGNVAHCGNGAAGLVVFGNNASIEDSTIAFNTTRGGTSTKYGAGVRVATANNLELQNTIISNNTTALTDGVKVDDLGGHASATTSGAANLVYYPSSLVTPGGTILLQDPSLRALANNGGPTLTHMPNFGSVVIDAGNNASGATVDQRGTGFPRIRGPAPDIGAVEFNLPDLIFRNGFD
ncbi:choice-of-anchor Q domain-containing protein [Dokdonella sp.]|uniref:choice-of-anchor Q domain-containing protein n=1 Tax=Dokdonella sp. TaxID=2291710 RepID=UPI00260F7F8F|nr:choice-of-anchor Q domain-containing protein [Dokdonella sp.]